MDFCLKCWKYKTSNFVSSFLSEPRIKRSNSRFPRPRPKKKRRNLKTWWRKGRPNSKLIQLHRSRSFIRNELTILLFKNYLLGPGWIKFDKSTMYRRHENKSDGKNCKNWPNSHESGDRTRPAPSPKFPQNRRDPHPRGAPRTFFRTVPAAGHF